jgi:hypothetical protein
MKRTEYNLNVINNFILHYTHDNPEMNCDEMYQAAQDHVDGEEMPEEEKDIFFTPDMKQSFEAGENFQSDFIFDSLPKAPDFVNWMEQKHNVKIS